MWCIKPLSEYHYEKNRDRYRGQCKQCRCNWRNAHRPKIAERLNAKARDRRANEPGYAERQRATHKKSREKHKDRWNAEQRERYANDPEYAERQRQYQRDYWANNPEHREKSKKQSKIYREENKEELRIKKQKYTEENKDKIRERQQKYYYDNPEHMKKLRKENYERNREKLVEEQRKIRDERRQYLKEYLGGKCVRCGATERLEFDHIIKETKSFTISSSLTCFSIEELIEEVNKCQLLCRPCHIIKSDEEGDWAKLTPEEKAKRKRR